MAKSKNHTNHNQSYKNHRNGIKPLARNKYSSMKGVNARLLRNQRRARKFDPSIKKSINLSKKIEALRSRKAEVLVEIKERIKRKIKERKAYLDSLKKKKKRKGKKKRAK